MTKQVILIASGDLRMSANQTCEAAQAAMEAQIAAASRARRRHRPARPSVRPEEGAWLYRQPEVRHGSVPGVSIPNALLIVAEAVWQYSHHVLHRTDHAHGADPDGRQLERDVAGTCRHAQPERQPDQSGRSRTARSGARSLPTNFSSRACASGFRRGCRHAGFPSCEALTRRTGAPARRRPELARSSRREFKQPQGDHG